MYFVTFAGHRPGFRLDSALPQPTPLPHVPPVSSPQLRDDGGGADSFIVYSRNAHKKR